MSNIVPPSPESLEKATRFLKCGGVVAFPTETYYGLAVDPFNPKAISRIFALKQRQASQALLTLVSGAAQLQMLAASIPALYPSLIHRFWPGPLTLIFPARDRVPVSLVAATKTIGIRHSPHPVAQQLIEQLRQPITATSANLSGQQAATTAAEVAFFFRDTIELIIDGGRCPGGAPSTIIREDAGRLCCLRQGVIPFIEIKESAKITSL